ncbi:ABC transporter ATP-binding protein [Halostagnicola kamekurae]|uniref:ABC-type D-xylose/L-arabinose transporter n=1 Tax=Halostagnicola kamekurae TaxID=619731 RepID=A0A1I6TDD5_9EURY|nr:ABC transporter ATP-binding protein [Halostagnicola kamekurae]SFS87212.1 multiple sugar transport system ATP-binding protein [Halostagnicola kamekurae]
MTDIKIRNLTKVYRESGNEIVAVDDVDLTIEDGEFVTLVGPSGCGKTTTLRCVAGLNKPTSGTITFGDRDVTDKPVQERNIALLFQDIALYPHMSVQENMAYGLKIAGFSREERIARVEEAAELLQITDQLEKMPADLSGGQQQRVALGRSLVRDPEIFLFDEPMSDLDAKLKAELRPVIEKVTDEIGCPTLYVTHDQEEAMTMSDRVAVINDGELAQVAPPKEVYDEPDSQFVSQFIGQPSTQFFDGNVRSVNGTAELDVGGYEYDLARDGLDGWADEGVRVGIRPQYIRTSDDPGTGIPATHLLDEPLGDATHSFFDTEFGEIVVVTGPDFEGDGEEYGLVFDDEYIQLFDTDSGVRIA